MKTGVKYLKDGLKSLHSTDAKSYLPDEQAYADKFAIKRATMIEMYAATAESTTMGVQMSTSLSFTRIPQSERWFER